MARNYIFRGYRLDDIDCFDSHITIYCANVIDRGFFEKTIDVSDPEQMKKILEIWDDPNMSFEKTERKICEILF